MKSNPDSSHGWEPVAVGGDGLTEEDAPRISRTSRLSAWRRIGGGSLTVSVMLHAAFAAAAVLLIRIFIAPVLPERQIDFLPSGGGGGKTNVEKVAASRREISQRQTAVRLVSLQTSGAVSLPDMQSAQGMFSGTRVSVLSGGGMGGGEGGLHGKGRNGLAGDGIGPGSMPGTGVNRGFVAMFGKTLQARKLAVVLDVSGSMHRFLPAVVKEANKVSGGCPIVMFYGCGLQDTDDRSIARQRPEAAKGKEFLEFWQRTFSDGVATANSPVPNEEVFKVFNGRRDTWFFERIGVQHTWLALTSPKVREADAIYWFADFQDPVAEARLAEVQKLLKNRKQKLYVHASGGANPSLAAVEEMLVKPTGGEVLNVKVDPVPAK